MIQHYASISSRPTTAPDAAAHVLAALDTGPKLPAEADGDTQITPREVKLALRAMRPTQPGPDGLKLSYIDTPPLLLPRSWRVSFR